MLGEVHVGNMAHSDDEMRSGRGVELARGRWENVKG